MNTRTSLFLAAGMIAVAFGVPASAQQPVDYEAAKGIIERTLAGEPTGQQAMDVAILVYSPQGGNPIQRAAHQNFFTGERFKLKIRASQSGVLQVVNVEQSGKENRLSPVAVSAGSEFLYPSDANKFLEFDSSSGNETLRLSLAVAAPQWQQGSAAATTPPPMLCPPVCPMQGGQPQPYPPSGAAALFGNAVGKAYVTGKGIREVVLEGRDSTQVVQPINGGGLSYDILIKHY